MGSKTRTASYTHLAPDTRYGSVLVSKFINCLMWDGKKATATRVVYDALDQIKKRMPDADPVVVFTEAVNNIKPPVEVRSRRVGGANYQVPMQVKSKRQESLAIRWRFQGRPSWGLPSFSNQTSSLSLFLTTTCPGRRSARTAAGSARGPGRTRHSSQRGGRGDRPRRGR